MEDILVTRFREYIRVNTMQPNPDYKETNENVFINWSVLYVMQI